MRDPVKHLDKLQIFGDLLDPLSLWSDGSEAYFPIKERN